MVHLYLYLKKQFIQAEKLLSAVPWADLKKDLAELISVAHKGYWRRHQNLKPTELKENAAAVQVSMTLAFATHKH